jgi:hypothetical protein
MMPSAPEVWEEWAGATLMAQVRERADALSRVVTRIEVGRDDAMAREVGRLSDELTALGIAHEMHEMEEFEGGHVAGVRGRVESSMLPWPSRVLRGETAGRR